MPATAAEVTASPSAISSLRKQANALSHVFQEAETVAEQACFLPIPERGRPIIGKLKHVDGVYLNAGASCWGITLGPGTGKVLSELILDGTAKSADISRLSP
jgi:glycine/D-amino acid oxidase-like deaminating enzyme